MKKLIYLKMVNADGTEKVFENAEDFILFSLKLYAENEETAKKPETVNECIDYITIYCEDWDIEYDSIYLI